MNLFGALRNGSLTAVELGSVLALLSCNTTIPEDVDVITPNIQAAPQVMIAGPALESSPRSSGQNRQISLESLPRDHFDVDWVRAVDEGYINPRGSIDDDGEAELVFDLDIVLRFNDPIIKEVLYSHASHTYWLDCETCHPKIFAPQVAGNVMTMKEINEGKYCGKCHGTVAFPTHVMAGRHFRDNCLKCHNYEED